MSWLALTAAGCFSNPTPHPEQPEARGQLGDEPDVQAPTNGDPNDDHEYGGGGPDALAEVPGGKDGLLDALGDGIDPAASLGDVGPACDPDAVAGDGGPGDVTGTGAAEDDQDGDGANLDDDDDFNHGSPPRVRDRRPPNRWP